MGVDPKDISAGVVYLVIFFALFFVFNAYFTTTILEPFLSTFSTLSITVRQVVLSGVVNVKASTADLGTTTDNFIYLLLRQTSFGSSSPYISQCYANDSESAAKCIVEMSVNCWNSYGEGKSDSLIGRSIGHDNVWGRDDDYFDFSIDCGIVIYDADSNDFISISEIRNYYSSAQTTTGEQTEARGQTLTYPDMLGIDSITDFVNFNMDEFPSAGIESSNKLIIKVKYLDIPNKLTNVAGWCGADAFLSDVYGWLSGGYVEFPCWHHTVLECNCPNGDCTQYPSTDAKAFFKEGSSEVGQSNDGVVLCFNDFTTYSLIPSTEGDSCSSDSSCTEGLKCNGDFVCAASDAVNAVGESCTVDADCEAGYGCAGLFCGSCSGSCSIDADCCLGYNCISDSCSPCGLSLDSCTSDSQCCSGLACSEIGCYDSEEIIEASDWGCDNDSPCVYGTSCTYHSGGGFGESHSCD